MIKWCMNTNTYEVHDLMSTEGCLPDVRNREYLGIHASCHRAVAEAKSRHPDKRIDGCGRCAPDCHNV